MHPQKPKLNPPSIPPSLSSLSESQSALLQEFCERMQPHLDTPDKIAFVDESCLKRYLRATKWSLDAAQQRLLSTLSWRASYQPQSIPPEEVQPEAVSGKQFLNGFDKMGRPILYLVPKKENTKASDRQLRFVVYNLEKAVQLMPEGVESLVIILDYDGMGILNAPSPNTGRKFMSILGDHYPERLGLAFVVNPTWYIWTFFTVCLRKQLISRFSGLFSTLPQRPRSIWSQRKVTRIMKNTTSMGVMISRLILNQIISCKSMEDHMSLNGILKRIGII